MCEQGAVLYGGPAQRLVGADPAGPALPPQRGCHGSGTAFWKSRAVQWQPPEGPGPGCLPGQVHPAHPQGGLGFQTAEFLPRTMITSFADQNSEAQAPIEATQ